MKWKVLSSEYLFKVPWLTVRRDSCELPNGKLMPSFYVLEYPTWVSAFALTKDNKVILVHQYRHGIEEIGIEVPGGVVDAGEEPKVAIERELLEETGHRFDSIEYLGKVCPNPSTGNNFMHMYLAKGGEKVAEQSLDETEELEVVLYELEEVKNLLRENKIMQSLHTVCMFYALNRLGEMKY